MDVDTPPRPVPALADLPPSATASTIPFNLEKSTAPPPSAADAHPLEFDATAFEATKAFGVEEGEHSADDDGNKLLTFLGRFRGESGTGTEPRRRRAAAAQGGRRKAAAHHDDDDEEDEPRSRGLMGMLSGGRAVSGSEFSFQVHHHHGASGASQTGPDGDFAAAVPGWFHSQTPYTLLGCDFSWRFPAPRLKLTRRTAQVSSIRLAHPPRGPVPVHLAPLPLHPLHGRAGPSFVALARDQRRDPPVRQGVRRQQLCAQNAHARPGPTVCRLGGVHGPRCDRRWQDARRRRDARRGRQRLRRRHLVQDDGAFARTIYWRSV